ncbi:hypothetical protein [Peribacillus simplex]|uniref:hypothetical protein n=1 Tax=Peribacillus simplex TaxID=1478 RepID=UPI003336BC86
MAKEFNYPMPDPSLDSMASTLNVGNMKQKNSGITDEAIMKAWPITMMNLMYVYKDSKFVIPSHKTWGDFGFASTYIGNWLESMKKLFSDSL